jgi:hypothetical protein
MCYGQRDPNIFTQILQCFSLSEKSIASEVGDFVSKKITFPVRWWPELCVCKNTDIFVVALEINKG